MNANLRCADILISFDPVSLDRTFSHRLSLCFFDRSSIFRGVSLCSLPVLLSIALAPSSPNACAYDLELTMGLEPATC